MRLPDDIDEYLTRYISYRPTRMDPAGLGLEHRQDWYVAPVSINRDTPEWSIDASNWAVLTRELERIDPDGNDWETHRFGHWGNGWFEIVIARPGSACALECAECAAALSNYPVLDDSDWSKREYNAACEVWEEEGDGGEMPEYECSDEGVRFLKR